MKTEIRILLVDDHQVLLEGLSSLITLNPIFKVVGHAHNGHEALALLPRAAPDLVILDVNMPGMDGIRLAERLHKECPQIYLLVLSMHMESKIISRMVSAGVRGYLNKTCPRDELYAAVEAITKGKTWFNESIRNAVFSHRSEEREADHTATPELSNREREILSLIADEFTQEEISDRLHISPHTVVYHRRKLLAKLGVRNTAGLIRKAIRIGILQ